MPWSRALIRLYKQDKSSVRAWLCVIAGTDTRPLTNGETQNSTVALQCCRLRIRSFVGWGLEPLRHSDQFGEGSSMHLLHDMTTMDLHRDLARAQLCGNLLVEHA
jgi:hypothetical protein